MYLEISLFALAGTVFGIVTGLIPGFHVNNVAFILLSLSPMMVFGEKPALLISIMIVACSISHTFLSFISTTFLGAPEGGTALVLLPAHSLLLEGRGYESVYLSAVGSFGAILFGFLFLIPFSLVISHVYSIIQDLLVFILIGISALLIGTERRSIPLATLTFFLAGLFGCLIFDMPVVSHFGLRGTSLFPALTGLFGLPTLIYSLMYTPEIPEQDVREPEVDFKESTKSILSGSTFGSVVGFLPGVTSAQATIISMLARGGESNREQVVLTLSSVNTANAFFCLSALFLILRPRSGATLAINEMLAIQPWTGLTPPLSLIYLLSAVLVSGIISYFVTIYVGRRFASVLRKFRYKSLIVLAMFLLIALIYLFTSELGLLILLVATFIGLIPLTYGVRRSHCMGVL